MNEPEKSNYDSDIISMFHFEPPHRASVSDFVTDFRDSP